MWEKTTQQVNQMLEHIILAVNGFYNLYADHWLVDIVSVSVTVLTYKYLNPTLKSLSGKSNNKICEFMLCIYFVTDFLALIKSH